MADVAAFAEEKGHLRKVFNSLSNDFEVQAAPQGDDRSGYSRRIIVAREVADERT